MKIANRNSALKPPDSQWSTSNMLWWTMYAMSCVSRSAIFVTIEPVVCQKSFQPIFMVNLPTAWEREGCLDSRQKQELFNEGNPRDEIAQIILGLGLASMSVCVRACVWVRVSRVIGFFYHLFGASVCLRWSWDDLVPSGLSCIIIDSLLRACIILGQLHWKVIFLRRCFDNDVFCDAFVGLANYLKLPVDDLPRRFEYYFLVIHLSGLLV